MRNSSPEITLVPLRSNTAVHETLVASVSNLKLAPGQDSFVGNPAEMLEISLDDPARHPFAIIAIEPSKSAIVVGMGVLHVGAGTQTGWADDHSAVLLRGFLIDHRYQGRGYGARGAIAAVELAKNLAQNLCLPARGVVLGVNHRNPGAKGAYLKAGFEDQGTYAGGRSGLQHIMYRDFVNIC